MEYYLLAYLVVALPLSAITITITRASIFEPFRVFVQKHSKWVGKLVSCPYCFSHWLSFLGATLLPAIDDELTFWLDYALRVFTLVTVIAPVSRLIAWTLVPFQSEVSDQHIQALNDSLRTSQENVKKLRTALQAAQAALATQAEDQES